MNVLIIEGDKKLAAEMCQYLSRETFACDYVTNYFDGLQKAAEQEYSCIVLNISIENGRGREILAMLKREGKLDGIIVTSSENKLDQKIDVLNAWADDFLILPFHFAELAARINAVVRRRFLGGKDKVIVKDLTVSLQDKMATINNSILPLTKTEYNLLLYFLTNRNRVVNKIDISEHLYAGAVDTRQHLDHVYSHIMNLRKKLQKAGATNYIETVYGMGYRLSGA